MFWDAHDPYAGSWSTQYKAVLWTHGAEQAATARKSAAALAKTRGRAPKTEIVAAPRFWIAEDYHQKYYLRGRKALLAALMAAQRKASPEDRRSEDERIRETTMTARVNGWLAGQGSAKQNRGSRREVGARCQGARRALPWRWASAFPPFVGRGHPRHARTHRRDGCRRGVIFVLLLGYRSDYAGHFLAGFGGTLALLALPLAHTSPLRWTPFVACVIAIALGSLVEATLFRIAIFDPVDFFNQSLGAVLAAACVQGRASSLATSFGTGVLALVFLTLGFWFAFSLGIGSWHCWSRCAARTCGSRSPALASPTPSSERSRPWRCVPRSTRASMTCTSCDSGSGMSIWMPIQRLRSARAICSRRARGRRA